MSTDDSVELEDYYSFLNVSRNATEEEIVNSYRRLSRQFHPDKHFDEKSKKDAEVLFNRAKRAFEVLSDPHKRAIYDTIGIKGLETEGWAVVQRTKTPQEIREEYERLQKEKEERYLRTRTNPRGAITVGVNATDLFEHNADYASFGTFGLPSIEVNSLSIRQSIDLPLDRSDTGILSANLNVENGTGSGSIIGGLRRVFSPQTWGELHVAGGQGPIVSFKVFRTVSKKSYCITNGFLHFSNGVVKPGVEFVIARQLHKHATGYLTWKPFPQSFMNTAIAWNYNKNQILAQIHLSLPVCFGMLSGTYTFVNDSKVKGSIKGGTFGASIEYGCETKVSEHSVIGASMTIAVPKGVTLKLKLNRANQTYLFSILLADELIPGAMFYGTIIPLLSYFCLKSFIIDPYKEREKEKKNEKTRQENAVKLAELRKEAESAVSLMTETYNRIRSQEIEKSGLVIVKALYGKCDLIENFINCETIDSNVEVMNVEIPMQCLVKDSTLVLTDAPKGCLPGLYDPCIGEDKKLFLRYKYRERLHEVFVNDNEKVRIPNDQHLLSV